ncbi:hypothetical protein CTAYLR_002269 [Chrysophaeum taylorii]|uniref:Uncharacterized protein n=1 Tax=Chrysophaeum taylorii TaxID=2483200 RepID=A0AAD7XQ82_9STRA|nr:hypothetical protein CTAYLR_002269 [Chrysophaeum taylorii]
MVSLGVWSTRLIGKYEAALIERPVPTKMATGGVLWGTGDVVAQATSKKKDEAFDAPRISRAVIYGTIIHAPIAHVHYEFLEWFVRRVRVSQQAIPLVKVFMEQFVYWGWVSNSIYHFALAKMEGCDVSESVARVYDRLWPTMKAQWAFWIPVQYVNFKMVPVRHQLNVVLLTSVVWTAALSLAFPPEKRVADVAGE